MSDTQNPKFSRRQQEIMDIIHRLGEASVRDIQAKLTEPPTDGALRRMLNILEERGVVEYRQDAARKVYRPRIATTVARERAVKRVVDTFFAGSVARAVASLLGGSDLKLSPEEKQSLAELVERVQEEGR